MDDRVSIPASISLIDPQYRMNIATIRENKRIGEVRWPCHEKYLKARPGSIGFTGLARTERGTCAVREIAEDR